MFKVVTSLNLFYLISFSVTKEATEEFPDLDPNIISAISIARRLQDPLSEYVKIGPSHLGTVNVFLVEPLVPKISKIAPTTISGSNSSVFVYLLSVL